MVLRWEDADDWSNARDREGVVAASYGGQYDADTVRLGWEPGYADKSHSYDTLPYTPHMEVYWPFETTETTARDVVGGWTDGYYNAYGTNVQTGERGPLGSNAWRYNGQDARTTVYWDDDPTQNSPPDDGDVEDDPTLSASHTVGVWFYIDESQEDDTGTLVCKGKPGQRGAWTLDIRGNGCRIGFGFWGDHGQFTGRYDWHAGKPSDYYGAHFIVATVGEHEERMRVYLDGEMQEIGHGDPDTWRPPLKAPYGIGGRPHGADHFTGRISDVMLAGGWRTHDECLELTNALTRGSITTAAKEPDHQKSPTNTPDTDYSFDPRKRYKYRNTKVRYGDFGDVEHVDVDIEPWPF